MEYFRACPAYAAWAAFAGSRQRIAGVEVLKDDSRSGVYRLVTENPLEPNIIVKRSSRERIFKESTAYERILPHLSLTVPRFHGSVAGREGAESYLFVDEVAGEEYAAADGEHRALAGEWLGRFHVASAELAERERHFERDPGYYRNHLLLASEAILRHRSNPVLQEDDLRVLEAILAQCELAARHWDALEAFCSTIPRCYAHGDFKSDNVRVVRAPSGGRQLVAFDWASVALQTPAVDVTILFTESFSKRPINADIGAYCATVGRRWPFMDVPRVRRLAYIGEVFRWAKAIRWAAEELQHEWPEQAMYLLRLYRSWMADTIDVAPWKETCVTRDRLETIRIRPVADDCGTARR